MQILIKFNTGICILIKKNANFVQLISISYQLTFKNIKSWYSSLLKSQSKSSISQAVYFN
ncbi:hypothetical protein AP75_09145 [Kaistella haifensis DSM 19056]|uniref:Uncharacterized protein n=1 Tax=Kaistella haifensis DSM 19056 TaxID=1450526 RepID=A0A246B8T6_9FLAO|nr:hypothetical protein AP75_09145 [Kaistella haifensis DSM 19056]